MKATPIIDKVLSTISVNHRTPVEWIIVGFLCSYLGLDHKVFLALAFTEERSCLAIQSAQLGRVQHPRHIVTFERGLYIFPQLHTTLITSNGPLRRRLRHDLWRLVGCFCLSHTAINCRQMYSLVS